MSGRRYVGERACLGIVAWALRRFDPFRTQRNLHAHLTVTYSPIHPRILPKQVSPTFTYSSAMLRARDPLRKSNLTLSVDRHHTLSCKRYTPSAFPVPW